MVFSLPGEPVDEHEATPEGAAAAIEVSRRAVGGDPAPGGVVQRRHPARDQEVESEQMGSREAADPWSRQKDDNSQRESQAASHPIDRSTLGIISRSVRRRRSS